MLPLFNTFLVEQISIFITGTALFFLIQLLLYTLPLLHQRRHFGLTFLGLERERSVSNGKRELHVFLNVILSIASKGRLHGKEFFLRTISLTKDKP